MSAWSSKRARTTWVLANLFVVGGFIAVVPLIVAAFVPGVAIVPDLPAGLAQVKQIPWIPGGLAMPILMALCGLVVMLVGSSVAARQLRLIDAHQRFRQDAMRRAHHYRSDARIEPTFTRQATE